MRDLEDVQHCEIQVDQTHGGVRLHYVVCGDPALPPLLLLPGQSMAWDSYQRVIPRLKQHFRVYSFDLRGHGRSQHTPGQYSFGRCAEDVIEFIRREVGRPCWLTGNSSGGIIAMIVAARAPEWVLGILLEDPPLFSTDWPRLRDDTWVHGFFVHTVQTLPDLPSYFANLRIPTKGRIKLMSFPRPLAWILGVAIRFRQWRHPGEPVDLPWLPLHVRLFVRGLSEYDVDFTRACVEGRMSDVRQEDVLAAVKCPVLLMKAYSFRHPELKLVGSMEESDIETALRIKPDMQVMRFDKPHVVHLAAPDAWCRALLTFVAGPGKGE